MMAHGTTTAEIKTGYGLDLESELKMLRVIERLDREHAIDIVPTFLAAHTVAPEFKGDADGYVDLVCREMLPAAWQWYSGSCFVEKGKNGASKNRTWKTFGWLASAFRRVPKFSFPMAPFLFDKSSKAFMAF